MMSGDMMLFSLPLSSTILSKKASCPLFLLGDVNFFSKKSSIIVNSPLKIFASPVFSEKICFPRDSSEVLT